jgi:nitronate monooxygenase
LPQSDPSKMDFSQVTGSEAKAWRDIWGSGQGIGMVEAIEPVAARVARLEREYSEAKRQLAEAVELTAA